MHRIARPLVRSFALVVCGLSLVAGAAAQVIAGEAEAPAGESAEESVGESAGESVDVPWLGCWQVEGGKEALWLESERCGWLREGRPSFFRVDYGAQGAVLESWARYTDLGLRLEDGVLVVTQGDSEKRMRPVEGVPSLLRVEPYELPDVEVDPNTVAAVLEDLRLRRIEDQRVRVPGPGGPSDVDPSEMRRVDKDNTEWLVGLIHELGWIDARRFGREAADAAFLLVQHSGDLRLQRTAHPLIQADVEAGLLGGQAFALLHDRLQLHLGYLQRYGSQIGTAADGKSVLMPCEDLAAVDAHRAEMGMGPLADYLALFADENGPPRPLTE